MRIVYTLMFLLVMALPAAARQVCEEVPAGWKCYYVDGEVQPWDAATGPREDYGQVFVGPVPGAPEGYAAYLGIVSPQAAQSAWVLIWPEGGRLVVLRVRLEAGVRRSALLNDVPGVRGFNAVSVRVVCERDAVVGLALHGAESVQVVR